MPICIKPYHIPFLLAATLLVLAESSDARLHYHDKHKLHRVAPAKSRAPVAHHLTAPLSNSHDPALFAAEVMSLAKRLVASGGHNTTATLASEEVTAATPELLTVLELRLLDLQLAVRHARELLDAVKALPVLAQPPPNPAP